MRSDARHRTLVQYALRYRELLAEADLGVPANKLREFGILDGEGNLCRGVSPAEARDAAAVMVSLGGDLWRHKL